MPTPLVVVFLSNVLYGTSYLATRLAVEEIPPAMLALGRLVIGSLVLVPLARAGRPAVPTRLSPADRWALFWMGLFGFAAAFALGNWGLTLSTATNAALLITVEPVSIMLLSPLLLGERLSRVEAVGALLTLLGATLVVLNGIPGLTLTVAPHWRGDLLLILSGLAYASYSLFGRGVLARHPALGVTAWSILWGLVAMVPLAALEWAAGWRPVWSPTGVVALLYLGVVITALGYLLWNWVLERVPAPRAAIFITVQPLVGALLGVWALGEPLSGFIVAGGALILLGLHLAVKSGRVG
ncbi:MAG TPA: DMT family transporter [Methylomirabilota bacterium]|nr:DMT family transporter [Methylomirabilota bacterium]